MDILGKFRENVNKRCDEVMLHAFSCEKTEWTYGEVDIITDILAANLLSKGAVKGDVCVCACNSLFNTYISIIANIKTGTTILIIDPNAPQKLNDYKLRDCTARFIITDGECNADTGNLNVIVFDDAISCGKTGIERRDVKVTLAVWRPEDIASISYTSGTTGEPKGALRSMAAWENCMLGADGLIEKYDCMSLMLNTNPWFAVYLGLMFPVSIRMDGITYLPDREMTLSLDSLGRAIADYRIEQAFLSPSYLMNYAENCSDSDLKLVYTTGDALRMRKHPGFDVLTQYGQSEAGGPIARIIMKDQADWDNIAERRGAVLGYPVVNMNAYILDKNGVRLKPNEVGLICVSGTQIGPGYINRPELTAQKYSGCPFDDYMMLNTGDYGYMDETGCLYMMGRNDTVININGQKVDIAEVEDVIAENENIIEYTVQKATDRFGENYLIAYCKCRKKMSAAAIRKHIAGYLPSYCVPKHIVILDSFPLNSNGKIDIGRLPAPEYESEKYIAPENDTEQTIISIIAELTSIDAGRIGVLDEFADLGLDSLMYSLLDIRLEDELETSVGYRRLVESGNVRTLAEEIIRSSAEQTEDSVDYDKPVEGPTLSILLECMLRDSDDTAYNNTILVPLGESVDVDRVNYALAGLVSSQEALHSIFTYDGRNIFRKIKPDVRPKVKLEVFESTEWNAMRDKLAEPFSLFDSLLYRFRLFGIKDGGSADEYYLMFDCHHSISDQHSNDVFCNEFFRLYDGGQPEEIVNNYIPFSESELDGNEAYWDEYYERIESQADVVYDVHFKKGEKESMPAVQTSHFDFDDAQKLRLEKFCAMTGFTKANVLLTAYQILISIYCQHDAFPVLAPFRGRPRRCDRNTIGMFVRVLPVVYENKGSIRDILLANQETLSEHQKHQISDVFKRKDKNSQDFVFNFINLREGNRYRVVESQAVRYKMIFYYYSSPEGSDRLAFEYDTSAFTDSGVERFVAYFNRVLSAVLTGTDAEPNSIELLDYDEKNYFHHQYLQDIVPVDEGSYFELFRAVAERQPDKTALIFASENGEKRLSYSELLDMAITGAGKLGKERVHLVISDNAYDTMCGCFAAIAAGKPFIYIDPEMPEEYRKELTDKLATADLADTLFYLYTSGTTGMNKVFPISDAGFVNECYGENSGYKTDAETVVAVTASPTFDMYYLTSMPVFLAGGTVVLLSEAYRYSITDMEQQFRKYGVSRTFMTTKLAEQYMLLIDDSPLKTLSTGGEALNKVVKRDYELVNIYGPAEAGIITRGLIGYDETDFSIGVPVNNMKVYVVDANDRLCPFGVPGEVLSGGPQLSEGYLSSAEADTKRFIDNPLWPDEERLYRSGDIAYISENGMIYFVGRKDRQVKINGVRIETDTIAAVALKIDGISQVHVLKTGGSTGERLVLFYIGDRDFGEELNRLFKEELPEVMIPAAFIRIDEMPLTANEKTDENRLRELAEENSAGEYTAPADDVERALVALTAEVLNIDESKIGVTGGITDIGCDSLSAMAMSFRVEEAYGISINPVMFMRNLTIRELAGEIRDEKERFADILTSYSDEEDTGNIPMVFIHTGNTGSEAYLPLAERLRPGTRFFCIENYNVLHNEERINGINNLAKLYCDIIEKIPNDGNFILGGWSYGGIIAQSMASMMEDRGYHIELILLDPIVLSNDKEREVYRGLNSDCESQEYLKQSPLFEKYREMGLIDALYENNRNVINDILEYEPTVCKAKCCLFKSMDVDKRKTGDFEESEDRKKYHEMIFAKMDNGLGGYTGPMEVILLYTDHDYFMKGEALETIASRTNEIYEEVNEQFRKKD